MHTPADPPLTPIRNRPVEKRDIDASALRALAQAAVNVELFTIPLYMGTLYSIHGMHEINGAGQTFYRGRLWPGAATTRAPRTTGERCFNTIFSVFIQEMLHLQLAANIAACVGVEPSFTSPILQNGTHGWTCFGPHEHVIPHILDLRDVKESVPYHDAVVNLAPLGAQQVQLFLAIEESELTAVTRIEPGALHKYFEPAPFEGWTTDKTEADLPLFGSIGCMYARMATYMTIAYDDGTTLWEYVFTPRAVQRELFNTPNGGHPMGEYPGFPTVVPTASPEEALSGAIEMIAAITDQGEGRGVGPKVRALLAATRAGQVSAENEVEPVYRSSAKALALDYPSFDADGKPVGSADKAARAGADTVDHFARFASMVTELQTLPKGTILTWDQWHAERGERGFEPRDLLTGPSDPGIPNIPTAAEVAGALNRLKHKEGALAQFSQVAAGSIYGITRVLGDYWSDPKVGFPFPAMGGSGDRMAICWAVLGEAPELWHGTNLRPKAPYYHACQGLDLDKPGENTMPLGSTFHTCIGSNECKGQGGCGFVQKLAGGGNCGASASAATGDVGGSRSGGKTISAHLASQNLCGGGGGGSTLFSPPADNACGGFGGCAVPISASQLYPVSGTMQLFGITTEDMPKVGTLDFKVGDSVYATAWKAYVAVINAGNGVPPAGPPPPDDLRLAFPPST
jgi:hypothetical protein